MGRSCSPRRADAGPASTPPSRTTATGPASAAAAAWAVVGVGSPWRFALVVASGPSRRASSRTRAWSGQRTPMVNRSPPSSSPRSSGRRAAPRTSPARARTSSRAARRPGTARRTSSRACSASATSTATGCDADRSFNADRRCRGGRHRRKDRHSVHGVGRQNDGQAIAERSDRQLDVACGSGRPRQLRSRARGRG